MCTVFEDHLQPNYVSLFTYVLHKWIQGMNRKEFEEEKIVQMRRFCLCLSSLQEDICHAQNFIYSSLCGNNSRCVRNNVGQLAIKSTEGEVRESRERERKKSWSLDLFPPPLVSITLVSSCCSDNQAMKVRKWRCALDVSENSSLSVNCHLSSSRFE